MTAEPPKEEYGGVDEKMASPPTDSSQKLLEDMKRFFEPVKKQMKHLNIRPWKDFAKLSATIPKSSDVFLNLEKNVRLYKSNYFVIFLAVLTFTILTTPTSLAILLLIIMVWALFLQHIKEIKDPNWVPVGGMTIDRYKRIMIMAGFTAITVIVFFGSHITWVLLCTTCFAVVHGILHRSELKSEEDEYDKAGEEEGERIV